MQIDLLVIQIDTHDFDLDDIAEAVTLTTAFAVETVTYRIEMIVVVAQLGDMHETFNENVIELHKQAEAGHRRHSAGELVADLVLHVFAFQPIHYAVAGSIRTTFRHRAVFT